MKELQNQVLFEVKAKHRITSLGLCPMANYLRGVACNHKGAN
jgi:hypothetical protein